MGRAWEVLSRPDPLPELWMRSRSAILRSVTRWNLLERKYNLDEMFPNHATWSEEERQHAREYFEAIWSHEFRGMPIDMVLFRVALDPFEGPHEDELGWRRVTTGRITVEYLPGTHERLLTAGLSGPRLAPRAIPEVPCGLVVCRFLLMGGRLLADLPNVAGPYDHHVLTDMEGPRGTPLSGWFDHSVLRRAAN